MNKGRPSFSVSHFANGQGHLMMSVDCEPAQEHSQCVGTSLAQGELDVLGLRNADRDAYVQAVQALKPTGMPLELAARDYAESWKALGGRASLLEAG